MNRILCRLFGHNWKVYHRKKSRTGPELNAFRKCKRCGKKGDSGYSVFPILRDMVRKGEENYTTHTREKGGDK